MPELPDITAYLTALTPRVVGQTLEHIRVASPLLLRTAVPRIDAVEGREVRALRRIGKRIVFVFDDELFLVLHLMIAGRLHWRAVGAKLGGRNNLAAFDFPHGSLVLTEAGTKRRASLHLVQGEAALEALDPGGIDVLSATPEAFREALTRENRTLKRALTDPRILSGIGNAYSDEILHAARLSPITQTHKLTPEEWQRLFTATRETLQIWIDSLQRRSRQSLSRKSHGVSARDGSAWALQSAVRGLRIADSAHPVCRQRNQLLSDVPDRRQSARRPQSFAAAGQRLAAHAG